MDSPSTRHVLDLTGWWHTWFDTAADWRVAPPPDPRTPPERLAPHAPSAGWEGMDEGMESLRVPGTWAESRPGYRGVAWHWRPLIVPPEYAGHTLWLRFEGVRLAAEVYLDRRLVGYDLDGLTPFEVDVTHLLRPNHRHELALRVTNPGGVLAGQGPQPVEWAGLRLPPSHDYGGLWGAVSLVARPAAHLGDVWAEGGETDDEVLVHATVRSVDGERAVRVAAHLLGDPARPLGASEQVALYLAAGDAREVTLPLRAAGLEPWSPERPALYRVRVTLAGEGFADALEAPYAPRRLGWTDAGYTLNGDPLEVRAARTGGWYPEALAFPSDRLAEDEVILYWDENDEVIPFKPGKTWIELMPLDHEVTIDEPEADADAARYDEAWEISGWQFEKVSDMGAAEENPGRNANQRSSREARKARHQEMLDKLAREREQVDATLYEQAQAAAKRAEQRLWDMSAPTQTSDAQIFSERFSSDASSGAVADAALRSDRWDDSLEPTSVGRATSDEAAGEQAGDSMREVPAEPSHPDSGAARSDQPTPDARIKRIVDEVGPVKITWRSRRKQSSHNAHLTNDGLIDIIGVGIFSDPTEAAAKASGYSFVDGWRLWQVPDGRALRDFH